MNLYEVGFEPIYPVGGVLIIAAKDLREAKAIAAETIKHTKEFEVSKMSIKKSGVLIYHDGDY